MVQQQRQPQQQQMYRPPMQTRQQFRPPTQGVGVQGQRAYVPNQGYQHQSRSVGAASGGQTRTVGSSGTQGQRGFGSFGSSGAQGQPRGFGGAHTVQGEHSFAGAGGEAQGQRRGFGGAHTVQGQHSFAGAGGGPHRSASGRTFAYHGQTFTRFAGARYHYPHGFAYRRYVVGHHFPREFWVHDYYINDYADYDLAPPPDDYQWIRFGPDIVLVDLGTGEIEQVVYGAFDEDAGSPDGDGGPQGDDQAP